MQPHGCNTYEGIDLMQPHGCNTYKGIDLMQPRACNTYQSIGLVHLFGYKTLKTINCKQLSFINFKKKSSSNYEILEKGYTADFEIYLIHFLVFKIVRLSGAEA